MKLLVGQLACLVSINELVNRRVFGCIHPEHKLHKSAQSNFLTLWHNAQ